MGTGRSEPFAPLRTLSHVTHTWVDQGPLCSAAVTPPPLEKRVTPAVGCAPSQIWASAAGVRGREAPGQGRQGRVRPRGACRVRGCGVAWSYHCSPFHSRAHLSGKATDSQIPFLVPFTLPAKKTEMSCQEMREGQEVCSRGVSAGLLKQRAAGLSTERVACPLRLCRL